MLLAVLSQWDTVIHNWISQFGAPVEDFLRLLVAALAGGMVGLERELRGRQAGFRTYLLVCVGSALVMIVSTEIALRRWPPPLSDNININIDPARIAYGVMGGIGFLGAGVIIQHKGSVKGLTTAAGLWSIAAVGLGAGLGMYVVTFLATLLIVTALWILDYFEDMLPRLRYRTVTIRTSWKPRCVSEAVRKFKEAGLRVVDAHFDRDRDPNYADIHLQICFVNKETYFQFERALEVDEDYQLIAARQL